MQTRKKYAPVCQQRVVTANSRHFLRVNAQMHNLDKQKTAQIRIPLVVSGGHSARQK